jgi:hypothetical protein
MMSIRGMLVALALPLAWTASAWAQFQKNEPAGAPQAETAVQRWKCGLIITASGGPCQRIVATTPVPVDWPEQQVKIASEDISPSARVTYQMVEGGVRQMTVTIAHLMPGQEAKAVLTLEIHRTTLLPPENPKRFQLPDVKKLDTKVRPYLGPSPFIESRNPKIIALAKQISGEHAGAWAKVEAFHAWVRAHVKNEGGQIKGAMAALKDGTGSFEEMTCLFIALCRASGIPARTVHLPGHCYPEFYLLDEQDEGHWFPCETTSAQGFGGSPDKRPILEKGDNFKNPQKPREHFHYLPEMVTGASLPGSAMPQIRTIRESLPGEG